LKAMTKRKELYIIRHGQTDYNKQRIIQGRGVNSHLNEEGRAQAKKFFQKYSHIPFEKVYTSTLIRTHQTVEPFLIQGLIHEATEHLDEFDWGIHEGQSQSPELTMAFEEITQSWRNGKLDIGPEGGETPLDVQERQLTFLNNFLSNEEELVLICMHGRCMRTFLCLLTNKDLSYMDSFNHNNTCLYHVIIENGSVNLLKENDLSHLD